MKISVRVNKIKATTQGIVNLLASKSISTERVKWFEYALIVECESRLLTCLEEYKQGIFYIQELSSMVPAIVLNPQPEENILDLCSAPGSKTIQIAEMCNDKSPIIANDISKDRIHKVVNTARLHGISSIETMVRDGESFGRTHPEFFDKVLVDVPCSMGQVYATKNLNRLIYRQRALIRSGFRALKIDGTLVYSTCSPLPNENEKVIDWLIKKEASAHIKRISIPDFPQEWIDNKYVKITKSELVSDFFVAKIKKTKNEA